MYTKGNEIIREKRGSPCRGKKTTLAVFSVIENIEITSLARRSKINANKKIK